MNKKIGGNVAKHNKFKTDYIYMEQRILGYGMELSMESMYNDKKT